MIINSYTLAIDDFTRAIAIEGNIYTESLGDLAYQNNPKFKKFIADNNLGFKSYASFGKNEITERIAVLVDLVKLVWNDDLFQ